MLPEAGPCSAGLIGHVPGRGGLCLHCRLGEQASAAEQPLFF